MPFMSTISKQHQQRFSEEKSGTRVLRNETNSEPAGRSTALLQGAGQQLSARMGDGMKPSCQVLPRDR